MRRERNARKLAALISVFREVFEAGLIGGGVLAVATLRDGVLMHRPNRHRGRVVQTCWHEGAPNAQTLK